MPNMFSEHKGKKSLCRYRTKNIEKTIVAFSKDIFTLTLVTYDRNFSKIQFDPINGGLMMLVESK